MATFVEHGANGRLNSLLSVVILTFGVLRQHVVRSNRERKCADTIGTVLVPWAGHFHC